MKNQTITIGVDEAGARAELRRAWCEERAAAVTAGRCGGQPGEWHHLERAHILSQPMTLPHLRTHVAMLGGLALGATGLEPNVNPVFAWLWP